MSKPPGFALADGTRVVPHVPFFIAGSGRCGTTLLRRLLIEQAQVVIPPENYLLAVSPRLMVMARGDWAAFCRLAFGNLPKFTANWAGFGIDAGAATALLGEIPVEQRSVANFWHAFHALYARHVGRPSDTSWGDKTPSSVDALAEIVGIFPAARFVFMVRDVFDMAYSYGRMAAPGRAGDYLGGARRWLEANSKLLAFREQFPALSLIVRYEDLVRDVHAGMARTLDHLGIVPAAASALTAAEQSELRSHADLRNVLQDVHRGSIGTGRAELANDIKMAIAAMAAPMQARLGYEPRGEVL